MTLFPIIQPATTETSSVTKLYKEIKWDFEKNVPVFKSGAPVIVTGKDAVLVWAWKALGTMRFRYEIYTWNYGNEAESLIGQPFTDELKQAEAARYVRECLIINPYITDVTDINVSFADGTMSISCSIRTVYGEANISV